jgi:hypothetical protein
LTTTANTPPGWFLEFWEQNCAKLPLLFRGESMMLLAWDLFGTLLEHIGRYMKTPNGMRQFIAFARIQTILQGSQGVLNQPDPTPEQVAEAVQRLANRVRS